jgi:hypothetical protein
MDLEQVQATVDRALATGKTDDKLQALETSVAFDAEHAGQAMGAAAVHSLLTQYEHDTKHRVRTPEETQQSTGVMFISEEDVHVHEIVANALGSYYGVKITRLDTLEDYMNAAEIIRASIAKHYVAFRAEQMISHTDDTEQLARSAFATGNSLLQIDYSIAGTSYFIDVVRALTRNS